MRILMIGAGAVGRHLAMVLSQNHEVTLIENRPERCEFLTPILPEVRLLCDDGCEPRALEQAHIKDAELVVALTGDDEDNLVISYLAKYEYDAPQVIARVNNPLNRWLFTRRWGVDIEVSLADMIETIVEEEISLGEIVTVMKLKGSDVALVEITVPEGARALGSPLAELSLPPETLIVTVARGKRVLIPKAGTVLEPSDRVLAITHARYEEELESVLGFPQ